MKKRIENEKKTGHGRKGDILEFITPVFRTGNTNDTMTMIIEWKGNIRCLFFFGFLSISKGRDTWNMTNGPERGKLVGEFSNS